MRWGNTYIANSSLICPPLSATFSKHRGAVSLEVSEAEICANSGNRLAGKEPLLTAAAGLWALCERWTWRSFLIAAALPAGEDEVLSKDVCLCCCCWSTDEWNWCSELGRFFSLITVRRCSNSSTSSLILLNLRRHLTVWREWCPVHSRSLINSFIGSIKLACQRETCTAKTSPSGIV